MLIRKFDFGLLLPGIVPGTIIAAAWAVIFINNEGCFTLGKTGAVMISLGLWGIVTSGSALFLAAGELAGKYKWALALLLGGACSMLLQYHLCADFFGDNYSTIELGGDYLLLLGCHLLLLLLPVVLAVWQRERCFKWRVRLTLIFCLTQLVYVSSCFLRREPVSDHYDFKEYTFSEKEKFAFGSGENIIIAVVDCMGERLFKQTLAKYPELKSSFRDFICFDNMQSPLPRTMYAVPALLTGQEFPADEKGNPADDDHGVYLSRAYREENSLFRLARKKGFRVEGYPFILQTISYAPDVIDNSEEISEEVRKDSVKKIFEVMALRLVPGFLEGFTDGLVRKETLDFVPQTRAAAEEEQEPYDRIFYQRLQKEFRLSSREKVFKYLHLHGAHTPVTTNENLETQEGVLTEQQLRGSLKIVELLLRKLKENDLYHTSTIVIVGDHTEKYTPGVVALIKRPRMTQKELKFNGVPCRISQISSTVRRESGVDSCAPSLFALPFVAGNPSEIRDGTRQFPDFTPWCKEEKAVEIPVPGSFVQGRTFLHNDRLMVDLIPESTLFSAGKVTVTAQRLSSGESFTTTLIKNGSFRDLLLPELKSPDGIYQLTVTEWEVPQKEGKENISRLIPFRVRVKENQVSICKKEFDTYNEAVELNKKMAFYPLVCHHGVKLPETAALEWNFLRLPEGTSMFLNLPELKEKCKVEIHFVRNSLFAHLPVIFVNGRKREGENSDNRRSVVITPDEAGKTALSFEYVREKNEKKSPQRFSPGIRIKSIRVIPGE